jgi:hypothetical protein
MKSLVSMKVPRPLRVTNWSQVFLSDSEYATTLSMPEYTAFHMAVYICHARWFLLAEEDGKVE